MSQGLPVDVKSLSSYAKFKQGFDDFVKFEEEKRSEFDKLVQEEQAGVQFALHGGSAFAPLPDLRRFEEHHALALAKHWHDLTLTCISVFNGIIPDWGPLANPVDASLSGPARQCPCPGPSCRETLCQIPPFLMKLSIFEFSSPFPREGLVF